MSHRGLVKRIFRWTGLTTTHATLVALSLVALSTLGTAQTSNADSGVPSAQAISPFVHIIPEGSYTAKVLSDQDVSLYIEIFEVQEKGRWKEADALIKQLSDNVLMGHVKLQRYMHPTAYRSKYTELRDWMNAYNDHPDATRIYKLAMRRKPARSSAPKKPARKKYRPEPDYVKNMAFAKERRSKSQLRRVKQINKYAKSLLARERPTQTLNYIRRADVSRDLTKMEFDRIKSWIAAQYFLERVPAKALATAQEVSNRNPDAVPMADWTAGLAAWEMGKHDVAAQHFEKLARAKYVTKATHAAGAYWAARAYLVTRNPAKVSEYLEVASRAPFTFYGVLANRQLGNEHAYDWTPPKLTLEGFEQIKKTDGVRRAVAFAQLGRMRDAEKELRRAHGLVEPKLDIHLLALAYQLNLPAAQLQIAEYAQGSGFDTGLYPIPAYAPSKGFQIDRALIYAFMRKESKFDPEAKSWAGARGLMQLMPRTASSVGKDKSLRNKNSDKLFDPGFNLTLGQKYVGQLMKSADPDGNLFELTVAYNGGPGNLRKWRNELTSNTDPLFFIESIPSGETRGFIEGVLTNLWIYRDRLGQDAPTLEQAASGTWPVYEALEKDGAFAMR